MFVGVVFFQSWRQLNFPTNAHVEDIFTRSNFSRFFDTKDDIAEKQVYDASNFYVLCNGKRLTGNATLESGKTYHVVPRLFGGKGGFGSMLRAIGAQIEKTTSREACRDLSGRRMRDINNEKKLKDWLAKEAEREQEREERKKEKLERYLRPQHKFEDAEYHEQKAKVQEDLQDALSTGLKRKMKNGDKAGPSHAKVSKAEAKGSRAEWLGGDLDSDDLGSSDSESEANPGEPGPSCSSQPGNNSTAATSSSSSRWSPSTNDQQKREESDEASPGSIQLNSTLPDSKASAHKDPSLIDSHTNSPIEAGNSSEMSNKDSCCHAVERETSEIEGKKNTVADVPSNTPVDLMQFSSSSELEVLGLDRLKQALLVRGLKCGGTLSERANRLILVKGLSAEEVKEKHPGLLAKVAGKEGKGKKSR